MDGGLSPGFATGIAAAIIAPPPLGLGFHTTKSPLV